MRSKILSSLLILLGVILCVGAVDLYAASLKIGVVDTPRVLRESKVAVEMRDLLLGELKEKRAVFSQKQAEVLEMETRLKVDQNSLSAEGLKVRQIQLADEVKNLRRLKADLEEDLERKNNEFTAKLIQDLRKVVVDYQASKDYTLILEKGNVVASDDAIDITDEIIKRYDKTGGK